MRGFQRGGGGSNKQKMFENAIVKLVITFPNTILKQVENQYNSKISISVI